ncbi:hypothetical protein B0H17DRAFT_1205230 [Mycena rosella]|uniref:Uncharacterized protein n=1 Tax=Mycena rosella TaxID=1033263 RepID=A0AAD7D8A2_MYCRO|nr:hypothetical protein B0H17DRAFT_1205230 [Mycena rosella]
MPTSHPSQIEDTLSRGGVTFLTRFFDTWDPSTIFLLGQLNYRLRSLVVFYVQHAWNVHRFLSHWFGRSGDMLNFLRRSAAIVCGPAVLQYFNRNSPHDRSPLNVCVDFRGFVGIGKFLAGQGYQFSPSGGAGIKDFEMITLLEAAWMPENRLKVHGERSVTQEDHGSRSFTFVRRFSSSNLRVVVVHLVRCELHRFVFAMHSTALMNYITSDYAVSVFPRTTFVKRRTLVSCQERFPGVDDALTKAENWLKQYNPGRGHFQIVAASSKVYADAEVGVRWVGDTRCWTIPLDPICKKFDVDGPAFDALDWRTGVTRHGSYLRVAEPFLWRLPIREKPLSDGMVRGLSAAAKIRSGAKRFYVYTTSGTNGEGIWVAPRVHDLDFKDFDLSNVFPNGCISVVVNMVPGTNMPLPSTWRIYMDSGRYPAPLNASVQNKFGVEWPGNLVLGKHRRGSDVHIAHIAGGEEDFVEVILGLWLKQFIHVKSAMGAKLHFKEFSKL